MSSITPLHEHRQDAGQAPLDTAAAYLEPGIPSFRHEVIPKNIPKVDVWRFIKLLRSGVPQDEAEEIVMQGWREMWARGCVARVAGTLFSRGVDPALAYELVVAWAEVHFELDAETVARVIDWVAERELQRRGGDTLVRPAPERRQAGHVA